MGVASSAIARGMLVGMYRSGAINRDQLEEVFNSLWQEAAAIEGNLPHSAEKVEHFIMDVHHQLRLDPPKLRDRDWRP